MTIPRPLALVIIAGTAIAGAFLGRAVPRDARRDQPDASVSPAPSITTPADEECEADRIALASLQAQLTTCMASRTRDSDAETSGVREPPEPEPTALKSQVQKTIEEEIRIYNERLASLSEAVIVRHPSGAVRVYGLDEWPSDGDGLIVARKFKNGEIGRYAGPDAGPRSDPAALRVRRKAP